MNGFEVHSDRTRPPDFLRVEEAAKVLRIGRTTAYALASEFLETNGVSGLPVVRLGKQLRVPRRRLEAMLRRDDHLATGQERRRDSSGAARTHGIVDSSTQSTTAYLLADPARPVVPELSPRCAAIPRWHQRTDGVPLIRWSSRDRAPTRPPQCGSRNRS